MSKFTDAMATTREWYWRSADGKKIFSGARAALVTADDAQFAAFLAIPGNFATNWPKDEVGNESDDELGNVLLRYGVYMTLAPLQASLCAEIDAEAEAQRERYITGGAGQAMVYLQKQTQAAQALGAPTSATAALYPLLAAEVGITRDPGTGSAATDVLGVARAVAATVTQWLPLAAAIERARLQAKAAITAASTADAARAARDTVAWPP